MKRRVIIEVELDPTEYHEAVDTEDGAIDLVIDMLRGDADLPAVNTIQCGLTVRHSGDQRNGPQEREPEPKDVILCFVERSLDEFLNTFDPKRPNADIRTLVDHVIEDLRSTGW